ncbi:M15 family metallopeptidase [Microbacterium terricola]|uniref:D-alanyl-D-alanine carboxypeptidase-like core domain-containing protein n=1 Tax=Microbacterium terricola TaxID=344163 RepID=A0ABM8DYV1_9MICO|nr:M15 family metallopeptidase [Microbacterium terricola]UYK41518.1 M15 family metallopeptidase [Microbacterium terricola]BDV30690.1 hypothetical protein Microterr_13500 [Microbacterium terricola]
MTKAAVRPAILALALAMALGMLTPDAASATDQVAAVASTTKPVARIGGNPAVGSTLIALVRAVPVHAALSYRWNRDGVRIDGASGSRLTLAADDAGARITVTVTVVSRRTDTLRVTSAPTAAVDALFRVAPTPTIAGAAAVGSVLQATTAPWRPAATLAYQWDRDGAAIRGATASTYRLGTTDQGARIGLTVTATRAGTVTTTRSATATRAVRPAIVTSDPSLVSVLVNKRHPLSPLQYVPADLMRPNVRGGGYALSRGAATALEKLFAGAIAAKAGELSLVSAYRSYAYQSSVFEGYVRSRGRAYAERVSARPGYSEHQTGLAADVVACGANGCGTMSAFGATGQSAWVAANAWRYGFIVRYEAGQTAVTGYTPEPWHLRYIGLTLAREYHEGGFRSYEQFLGAPAAPSYR